MKKAPLSSRHQARRLRALERFTTKPRSTFNSDDAYKAYCARKEAELASLKSRLGHNTLA